MIVRKEGWKILAARYGHNYVAQSGRRDNFPQQVTSRYPITTKKKITSTGNTSRTIWHGASIQKISVEGHDLHFITLHNYPFSYAPGLSAEEQPASSAAFEGEAYRVFEMNYILDCTCLDPEYRSQPDWLMMGDFNAICRRDNTYYKYADNDARFQCMDVVTEVERGKGVRFERKRRVTGYISGDLNTWNSAKRAEERDRVKHC